MTLNTPEPTPTPNDRPAVWDLVIADMRERDRIGREKYGTPLQADNGRDPLVDLYQELLDAVVYLRQHMEETKPDPDPPPRNCVELHIRISARSWPDAQHQAMDIVDRLEEASMRDRSAVNMDSGSGWSMWGDRLEAFDHEAREEALQAWALQAWAARCRERRRLAREAASE